MRKMQSRLKPWPWNELAEDLQRRAGWKCILTTSKRKVFDKKYERIMAVRIEPKYWKADHFIKVKLVDSSGMADEEFVKRIIYEMGVLS